MLDLCLGDHQQFLFVLCLVERSEDFLARFVSEINSNFCSASASEINSNSWLFGLCFEDLCLGKQQRFMLRLCIGDLQQYLFCLCIGNQQEIFFGFCLGDQQEFLFVLCLGDQQEFLFGLCLGDQEQFLFLVQPLPDNSSSSSPSSFLSERSVGSRPVTQGISASKIDDSQHYRSSLEESLTHEIFCFRRIFVGFKK